MKALVLAVIFALCVVIGRDYMAYRQQKAAWL